MSVGAAGMPLWSAPWVGAEFALDEWSEVDLPVDQDASGRGETRSRCRTSQTRSEPCHRCLSARPGSRRGHRSRAHRSGADTEFASLRRDLDVTHLSDVSQMKDGAIYANSLPAMVRFHAQRRTSHVLVTSLDENWGAFSSHIPNRTYPQGDRKERVMMGAGQKPCGQYLDRPLKPGVRHAATHGV